MDTPTTPTQASQFEAVLRQMRAGFLTELPERCDRLENCILALESGNSPQSAYDELYRNVHSLKGSGGTFSLSVITSICHQFESFLADAHGRYSQAFGSASLEYVDLLRQVASLADVDKPDFAPIESSLEHLRRAMLRSRHAILVADSSPAMRGLYQQALSPLEVQITQVDNGLAALDRLLHQTFDLFVSARELAELGATAIVAALRESRCRNHDIPVVLVSSSQDSLPGHLRIHHLVRRDRDLAEALSRQVRALLKAT